MCKTIKHKVRFKASPETIYDLLADSRKRTEVTGRKAVISDKVGGKFSTDAGQVTGVNVISCRDVAWCRRGVERIFPRASTRWRPLHSIRSPAAAQSSCSHIAACRNTCSMTRRHTGVTSTGLP